MVLEPAEAVGGDEGEDQGGGDDGPLDDVEHEADAVAAHAGLDELRFEADLLDLEARDLLFDGLGLVVVVVVHCPSGVAPVHVHSDSVEAACGARSRATVLAVIALPTGVCCVQ